MVRPFPPATAIGPPPPPPSLIVLLLKLPFPITAPSRILPLDLHPYPAPGPEYGGKERKKKAKNMVGIFSRFSVNKVGHRRTQSALVLGLLEVVQLKSPDLTMKSSQAISNMKYGFLADDMLRNPSTIANGGIYYYSERGDLLIDLTSFRDKLWQKFNSWNPQLSFFGSEAELNELRETIQQLLRWGWKFNKNLEEQAAQLHVNRLVSDC